MIKKTSSFKVGFGFGLASGVITTMGLMIGLYASTLSKGIVLGGILTIAVTDALSDALGIHFAEEAEGIHSTKEIWLSTISTFFSKFFVSLSFIIAIVVLPLKWGILANIIWGFILVGAFSVIVASYQKNSPLSALLEHYSVMIGVVFLTYYIGKAIEAWML